jgi:rod shape-determining protein MreC
MDSFFTRFRNPLVLLAVVLVQTIALAVQVPHQATAGMADGPKTTLLRYWALSVIVPFERAAEGTGHGLRYGWSDYIGLRHTHRENEALKQEVARLRLEQAAFAEDAAHGRRLDALLAFKQHYIATTVAAQVIGTSGSDRSRVLTLDKGAADGLKPDQAVMTPDGIVGKLRDVFPHTAQLLLLNDPTSGAGVVLENSRLQGIISGTADGKVEITNLTQDSRIKVGEPVVTSGGDQVYPRGLPVGVIASMAPDPARQPYMAIVVKPAANLSQLEEVLVITGTDSRLAPQAQLDANLAGATAVQQDTAQKAADLRAASLPGLHGDTAKPGDAPVDTTVGGLPNMPNSGVPRVTQPVHADVYSPGATPSAEDLKPGARHDGPAAAAPESGNDSAAKKGPQRG